MKMVSGTADFSPCMRYRYTLTRSWDATLPELLVVMLNPSTADAMEDDPTIRRVRGFAERWGFGNMRVMNLFALRSKDPRALLTHDDPIGPENDDRLRGAFAAATRQGQWVLAAWGRHGNLKGRAFQVLRLADGVRWFCLGQTLCGQPKHPLYVRGDQMLTEVSVTKEGGA